MVCFPEQKVRGQATHEGMMPTTVLKHIKVAEFSTSWDMKYRGLLVSATKKLAEPAKSGRDQVYTQNSCVQERNRVLCTSLPDPDAMIFYSESALPRFARVCACAVLRALRRHTTSHRISAFMYEKIIHMIIWFISDLQITQMVRVLYGNNVRAIN